MPHIGILLIALGLLLLLNILRAFEEWTNYKATIKRLNQD